MEKSMDKFVIFAALPKAYHELLQCYISPTLESSVYKSIPIKHYDDVRNMLNKTGIKFRYKFRGPRYDHQRSTCLKSDAYAFSVYTK